MHSLYKSIEISIYLSLRKINYQLNYTLSLISFFIKLLSAYQVKKTHMN